NDVTGAIREAHLCLHFWPLCEETLKQRENHVPTERIGSGQTKHSTRRSRRSCNTIMSIVQRVHNRDRLFVINTTLIRQAQCSRGSVHQAYAETTLQAC